MVLYSFSRLDNGRGLRPHGQRFYGGQAAEIRPNPAHAGPGSPAQHRAIKTRTHGYNNG